MDRGGAPRAKVEGKISMIVIAGTAKLKPGMLDEALRLSEPMIAASRAEAGCLHYGYYLDPGDSTKLFVFEVWESAEALERHFQTPHLRAFTQGLPPLLAGPLDIRRYEIESVSPLGL